MQAQLRSPEGVSISCKEFYCLVSKLRFRTRHTIGVRELTFYSHPNKGTYVKAFAASNDVDCTSDKR